MKANYGIDAPGLVRFFAIAGLVAAILCLTAGSMLGLRGRWEILLAVVLAVIAIYFTGMCCLMVYYSLGTKLKDCDRILNQISWRGDELVLDVGCGRGLMMVGAAKRLTSGKAIGVDIWAAKDQSANSAEGALENAEIAGVAGRVEVQTADMRKLPFADGAFDVVVSNWVVHNLEILEDRKVALSEMNRVLKPGGVLLISDIVNRNEYMKELNKLNLSNARLVVNLIKDKFLRAVSFGSFGPTMIIATKPH
jgi:arsenite methyltransferase